MITPPTHCLECNAPLSPAETQGLCARCLLKMGLASQFGESSVADAGTRKFVPPPMFPFDFGGYRVLRLLGRGGMGAVYEAEQRDSGRRVALKVLGHTIDTPDLRARFLREGRLAASVNHPNSVYIFGTEEIEGAPVIAMELVAGGTLRDRIRKGPLPVREAVDAILQVIAGLEAAASAGVLHRDVKPANCFVAPDGTVKVGDFGLSVSTLARHDSQLTVSGVLLGTPSFAPPEQLRGDDIDVRADIYSVGATLYSLLTGHAPFEGDNAVQVVAAVLDKAPKPIAEFRKDVPAGLAQIVARCLAKKRGDRFADYAALRDALLPFSTSVPEPAPLGLRFVAGFIDCLVFGLPTYMLMAITGDEIIEHWLSERTGSAHAMMLGYFAFFLGYFALFEGRWGAAVGKALCGLRVAATVSGAPGLRRSAARALLYSLPWFASAFIPYFLTTGPEYKLTVEPGYLGVAGWSMQAGFIALLAGLFVTARRRNGFAGLHDLATDTRVIVRRKSSARPRLKVRPTPLPEPSEDAERIGPFRVVAPIAGAWLVGYDDVLRRCVWIRRCAAGASPVSVERRELGRPGRLRWLAGVRSDAGNWDAFEAVPGKPLREIRDQTWLAVRGWLHDLAEEIDAASKDGTLPAEVGLDHVLITAEGRALLLDEPWPANKERRVASADPEPRRLQTAAPWFSCAEPAEAQRFLSAVADSALDRSALPLHAREFLDKLAAAAFDRMSFIVGNLQSLLAKTAVVSQRRRCAALALLPGAAVCFLLMVGVAFLGLTRRSPTMMEPRAHEWESLSTATKFYAGARGEKLDGFTMVGSDFVNGKTVSAVETHISGHFRKLIDRPAFDLNAKSAGLSTRQCELARMAVAAQPAVTAEQLAAVDAWLPLAEQGKGWKDVLLQIVPALFGLSLIPIGVGSLLGGVVLGVAPMLHVFGLAVVDRAGRPASRLRLLARAALVWVSLLPCGFLLCAANGLFPVPPGVFIPSVVLAVGSFLLGVPWTILRPAAGPHDRLTGTRVVPR